MMFYKTADDVILRNTPLPFHFEWICFPPPPIVRVATVPGSERRRVCRRVKELRGYQSLFLQTRAGCIM